MDVVLALFLAERTLDSILPWNFVLAMSIEERMSAMRVTERMSAMKVTEALCCACLP